MVLKLNNSNDGNTPWKPAYKWMGITAGAILFFLVIMFFVLNIVLKPYMRELPSEITPWLDKSKKEIKAVQPEKIEQDEENAVD
ncbi:MAG: hypothetical protein FWH43_05510 [Endomicrobia bacterium]|nr:hypothetical protein [Endomicrobiia bacterium]